MLHAEKLKNDPRVKQAKALIREALIEHQNSIQKINPQDPTRKIAYQEMLDRLEETRGAKLYFPYIGSGIGNNSFVELSDGSIKYDMITGIGVHFFGHSHPDFLEATVDAALSDIVMQGNLQQNDDGLELSSLLIKESGLPHCFLSTSGVMANENALKIAFQKNAPAQRILAFDHCFAGRSLSFSQVTDKPAFREGLPLNVLVDYIPYFDAERPEASLDEAKKRLLQTIQRYPKGHAIMIFELVQGEGGFYAGSKLFFETLMKICKEHHIAVFADEVQSFARTPSLFAFQHFGLSEYVDIAAVGKLSQAAATLFTKEYAPRAGLLSQTFIGSTSALKVGKLLIEKLIKGNYYGDKGRIAAIHKRFEEHLKKIPHLVKGPFGIGCMVAFTPLDGSYEKTTKAIHALYEAGVMTFIAGSHPSRIRMLVPGGVIKDEEIDAVMKIIESTLEKVASDVSH